MDTAFALVCLAVFGVILGSFAGASVWRIRAHQLANAKRDKEPYDAAEYRRLKPLVKRGLKEDRSQCLSCGHVLHFIDLLPLVSWLITRGKCRYCHQPIGYFEPMMEFGVAISFILMYLLWPYGTSILLGQIHLILLLLAVVPLSILFAYDLKWFLLPSGVTYSVAGIGVLVSALTIATATDKLWAVVGILGAIATLSGIYLFLNRISRGKWVGFGDVELGFALALLLADWKLGFIALFAANFIGCMLVLPGILRGSVKRTTEVQFGPLLIAGSFVALLFGHTIIAWYTGLL